MDRSAPAMAMDKKTALMRIDAFAKLPRGVLAQLSEVSGLQHIGRGSTLFRENERAHFVYAIVDGRVSLVTGAEREESIVDFVDDGDIILIPPALLQLPYMATAKATTDVLALLIPAADFRHLAETELPFAVIVTRILAAQWRLLLKNFTQARAGDAEQRLIRYLLERAGTRQGAAKFSLPGSKRELAAHLGMTPETLSRALKRLSVLGVATSGANIEIVSVARLKTSTQDSRSQMRGELASTSDHHL
ncbi:MAG: helix-turn-helix domain-containing protein [Proteobacteria bacterium]|nr:helix-turn-helix domain-containing protein [Pseudomonadota bacterium]